MIRSSSPSPARRLPMAALALLAMLTPDGFAQNPERGRDPWVFRLTLENKTRMLVAALSPDLWVAYNPANGTLHKAWSGGIDFRGKVYDFGQRNSRTLGTTHHLLEKAFLLSPEDEESIPAGWSATGVSTGDAWSFAEDAESMLVTRSVDLTGHDRVILAYRTPGADDRLRVDVSADGGQTWTAQQWMSIDGAADDGHHKLVEVKGPRVRFRFRRDTTDDTARLADVTLFSDYRAWRLESGGETVSPTVDWRGYRLIEQTEGVAILYDLVLPDGGRIAVEERPEALSDGSLERRLAISGMPDAATLSLELDGVGSESDHTVSGGAALRDEADNTYLDFSADGEATLETRWSP